MPVVRSLVVPAVNVASLPFNADCVAVLIGLSKSLVLSTFHNQTCALVTECGLEVLLVCDVKVELSALLASVIQPLFIFLPVVQSKTTICSLVELATQSTFQDISGMSQSTSDLL